MTFPRILAPPQQSFFLFGPRGAGKSTWLHTVFPTAHYIDLLSEETYQRLLAHPELFADELRAVPSDRWVVVDEVHRLIGNRRLRFVLCGSSVRKLKQAGVNLLAGRALNRTMHPFVPEELGDQFNLEAVLRYGSMPIVWDSTARDETLQAYGQLYLKEEIQAEALVRNLPGFARFLPIAALFHAQTINTSTIAREAGVARTTVAGYLEILVQTLLCFQVDAFEAKLRVRERKLPKWYWCDPGIVRIMKKAWGPVVPEERGALFEGLVAQLIRAYKAYRGVCDEFFYWGYAGASGTGVDFLLVKDSSITAVEVKSGRHFLEGWCKGLRAIVRLKGLRRRMIVYPAGPVLKTSDGIEVVPLTDFAVMLAENDLWKGA